MTNSNPVPRYKPLEKWNSGTADTIIRRHPNGFAGYVIQGERGLGKSMYAYKVMAKVYYKLGEYRNLKTGKILPVNNELDAYKASLEYMIFSPKDLINLIDYNTHKRNMTPVLCLDDATVHFNSYKFFVDLYEVILLKGMFDTIRTVLTGLMMTCPKRRNLLSFLRDYDDYKIDIKHAPGNPMDRYARAYQFNWYPDDRKFKVTIPYQDKYSCFVPDERVYPEWGPYEKYMEKRESYALIVNETMKKIMEEKKKRSKKKQPDLQPQPNI